MSTDLREALREAAAHAPYDGSDPREILEVGSRRVRRRAALVVGSSALAVVAVIASVVAVTNDPAQEPRPARVVRVDLDQAQPLDLQPTRQGGRDRFVGLTPDSLVLRSRNSGEGAGYQLGLLDPGTGTTQWLPPAPTPARRPYLIVQLTVDRLVLLDLEPAIVRSGPSSAVLLVFDRGSRTWQTGAVLVPAGLEAHLPPSLGIGIDGRLYLGHTYEGESGPVHWWSYPVPQGGGGRPEPTLTGASIAFGDGLQARAESDGRVVLSTPQADRVVAQQRPEACESPSDPDVASWPVRLGLAGSRPVVTYWCGDPPPSPSPRPDRVTVVYDPDGGKAVEVAGSTLLVADQGRVLLDSAQRGPRAGTYLLDLEALNLARIDAKLHSFPVGLGGGLLMWANAVAPLP